MITFSTKINIVFPCFKFYAMILVCFANNNQIAPNREDCITGTCIINITRFPLLKNLIMQFFYTRIIMMIICITQHFCLFKLKSFGPFVFHLRDKS